MFEINIKDNVIIVSFMTEEIQQRAMSGVSCFYEDPRYLRKYIKKQKLFLSNFKMSAKDYQAHNNNLKDIMVYYEL